MAEKICVKIQFLLVPQVIFVKKIQKNQDNFLLQVSKQSSKYL